MDELTEKLIEQTRKLMREGDHIDYHLLNYILRDAPVVKNNKALSDLSWTLHESNRVSKRDIEGLIEYIEVLQ